MRRPDAAQLSRATVALALVLVFFTACAGLPAMGNSAARVSPKSAPAADLLPALADAVQIESGKPGPRVAIVGGIHWDESSGIAAAEALPAWLSGRLACGTVMVVAVANPLAAASRSGPSGLDLNRLFPGGEGSSSPEAVRARDLFAALRGYDLVLDLHEEGLAWLESDRPTLVTNAQSAAIALAALEGSDGEGKGLSEAGFAFTGGAPHGSLNHELGQVGTAAVTIEVPARLPLPERLELQTMAVTALLSALGLLSP